jgi:hypothetical protein
MTLSLFNLLSAKMQLRYVVARGTYLAQRWDEELGGVNLYYLPGEGHGFFAEVGMEAWQDCFAVLRSFNTSAPLEEYARQVQLPEL